MPWLRKYRLRADEDIGVTRSNFNRNATDSTNTSVYKNMHRNEIAVLKGEIEFLKCELEKAKVHVLMAELISKDDRIMSSCGAEEEKGETLINDSSTENTCGDSKSSSALKR